MRKFYDIVLIKILPTLLIASFSTYLFELSVMVCKIVSTHSFSWQFQNYV